MILAPKDDLLVDIVEDGIQISSELSNTGQMDMTSGPRKEKRGQLYLLGTGWENSQKMSYSNHRGYLAYFVYHSPE